MRRRLLDVGVQIERDVASRWHEARRDSTWHDDLLQIVLCSGALHWPAAHVRERAHGGPDGHDSALDRGERGANLFFEMA
jgi:hypothetical protein